MAVPRTRTEFKDYCLRRLGAPVIEINVANTQVDDRVDEALKYWFDYHHDGSQRTYIKHQIDANTVANGYITLPEDVLAVTQVFDLGHYLTSSQDLFNIQYHVAMDTVYNMNANQGFLFDYYMTRVNLELVKEILVGKPLIRFNRHTDKLFIDIDKRKLVVGQYIVMDAHVALNPNKYALSSITITTAGTGYTNAEPITVTSSSDATANAYITTNGSGAITNVTIVSASADFDDTPTLSITSAGTNAVLTPVMIESPHDGWSDRWLQNYATALIKRQWGMNLSKFQGLQLPGGITFNGDKIHDDAHAEITKLEDEVIKTHSLPVLDLVG